MRNHLRSSAKTATPVLTVLKKTDENAVQNITPHTFKSVKSNSNKFVKVGTNIVSSRSVKSLRSENIQRELLKNDTVLKERQENKNASKHSSEDKKENEFKKSTIKLRKCTRSRIPLSAKALNNVQTIVKAARLRVTKLTANRKLKKNILDKIDQANMSKAKSTAGRVTIVKENTKLKNKVKVKCKVQMLKDKKPSKGALQNSKLKVKPVKKIERSMRRETTSVSKDKRVKECPSIGDEEASDCESRMEWTSEEEYKYRARKKDMSLKCKVCLLIFPTYHILNRHKAKHMEVEKPYKCQYCAEAFSDVVDLSAHIRVHKGKHPYTCRKCGKRFWTKSALDKHKPRHHLRKLKPPEKKFRCDVCTKEFSKLSDFERHTRVHTGEKPSVCNKCNRRFHQAFNLSKHLLTHLGIKPFTCEICNKQFGRADILDRHILTHSVNKPFKCRYCTKGFIRPSQLSHHIKKCRPGRKDTDNADDEGK